MKYHARDRRNAEKQIRKYFVNAKVRVLKVNFEPDVCEVINRVNASMYESVKARIRKIMAKRSVAKAFTLENDESSQVA